MIIAAIIISIVLLVCVWWLRKCRHSFVVIKMIKVYDEEVSSERPVATKYIMQCKKCGIIKRKEV